MNVFVSYRRADTQDLSGRIADRLRAVAGIDEVFLDITGIAPGADFVERIEAALSHKPIGIVLVGPAWRGPTDAPRIFDENDVVRMELARMFAEGLRILPVLAGGATMPLASELPEGLRKFASLNALPMRHESFERDLGALVHAILPGAAFDATKQRYRLAAMGFRALVAFLISGVGLIVAAVLHNAIVGRSLDESLGGPGAVWLLILGVLLFGTLAGTLTGRKRPRRLGGSANGFLPGRSRIL